MTIGSGGVAEPCPRVARNGAHRFVAVCSTGASARLDQPGCRGPVTTHARAARGSTIEAARAASRYGRRVRQRAGDAPPARRQHEDHAGHVDHLCPSVAGVGPGAEAVDHGDRPRRPRREMHGAPHAVAEMSSQEAGDDDGEEQVEGDGAEPEPHGAVRRAERDDGVEPADWGEAVDDRGGDVHGEGGDGEERQVAVESEGDESGPSGRSPFDLDDDADGDAGGQHDDGDDAAAAREVPHGFGRREHHCRLGVDECVGGPAGHDDHAAVLTDQTGGKAAVGEPRRGGVARAGSRPWRRRWRRRRWRRPRRPCASTSPPSGRWRGRRCDGRSSPPRRHRRAVVPEVAMPPAVMTTVGSSPSSGSSWRSERRTTQPPAGAGPATATSPPRLTSTPAPVRSAARAAARSAHHALAVAPRSSSTPTGTVTRVRREVEVDRSPSRHGLESEGQGGPVVGARRRSRGRSRGAATPGRSWDRRVRPSRRPSAGRRRGPRRGSPRSAAAARGRRARAMISLSGRNRLQAASRAAISAATTARATGSASALVTTTTAVVPSAGKRRRARDRCSRAARRGGRPAMAAGSRRGGRGLDHGRRRGRRRRGAGWSWREGSSGRSGRRRVGRGWWSAGVAVVLAWRARRPPWWPDHRPGPGCWRAGQRERWRRTPSTWCSSRPDRSGSRCRPRRRRPPTG